jgi:CHRD domain
MTKRAILAACTALLFTLAASPASAQIVRLTAKLNGGNETPAKILTGAFGNAECTVDLGKGGEINCTGSVFNLPSGATVGHIHVGAVDVSGPTVCNANLAANISNDFNFTIGPCTAATITLRAEQGIRSFEDFVQAVLGENSYVNIHSVVNPGGEIRGPLLLKP